MKLKNKLLLITFLSLFVSSCSDSASDIPPVEEPILYPAIIKGRVDGREVFIENDLDKMYAQAVELIHRFPRNTIGKELIYTLRLKVADGTLLVLNVSNPTIIGHEYNIDAYSGEHIYDSYTYLKKEGTYYIPNVEEPIKVLVKDAISYSYERNENYITLVINGTFFDAENVLNTVDIENLEVIFFSRTRR